MLVCPLQGLGGVQGKECFLRVTSAHLFEVELQAARTLERLELQSLVAAELESETETQGEPVSEVSCGVRCLGRGSRLFRSHRWEPVGSCVPCIGPGYFPSSLMRTPCQGGVCAGLLCVTREGAKGWTLCKGFVSDQHCGVQSSCFSPSSV